MSGCGQKTCLVEMLEAGEMWIYIVDECDTNWASRVRQNDAV